MKLVKSRENIPDYLISDNWFSPEEEKRIWQELEFYTHKDKFHRAETSGNVATNDQGQYLGEHFRIQVDSSYTRQAKIDGISDILRHTNKFQNPELHRALENASKLYAKTFMQTNVTYSLLSYYENNDYYKPHHDIFFWTALIWFFKEPKAFTGGDLIFPEFNNYRIECKHNRMLMFPCYYLHGVETIKIPKDKLNKGLGRYTITHFFHFDEDLHVKDNGQLL